jgi:outer membrane protein insertion porin family
VWLDPGTRRSGLGSVEPRGALAWLAAAVRLTVALLMLGTAVSPATAWAETGITAPAPRPSAPPSDTNGRLRYVLDSVNLVGNTATRASVVFRYIPFAPGDILDVDDPRIALTRYRLLGTGFFREVTLSLSRGEEHGHVVLNVAVIERNTLIVSHLWLGVAASADTDGERQSLSTFAGLDGAETNLLGTGIALGPAVAFSSDQFAGALRFYDPSFLGSSWMTTGEVRYNAGLGFFGNAAVRWDDPTQLSSVRRQAVVKYEKIATSIGLGTDLSVSTQFWLNYRLENVVSHVPLAASHEYGGVVEPIDFHILSGRSVLSTLRGQVQYDSRDQPFLTTSGWSATLSAEVSLRPLGSSYNYQRVDLHAAHWWPLFGSQTLMVEAFVGAIAGRAPFFEQYYIGDLSDLLPSRVLGLAFDDRPAPNLLGTSISEIRYGDYAARVGLEYRVPLYRGTRSIYGIDAFVGGGIIGLAGERDIARPPRNRSGAELIPVDLTGNLGLRLDTTLGGFSFSLSNAAGFLLARGNR